MSPILSAQQITVRFGGIVALDQVDLEVAPGTIHAVIGPNGAGKSTLLNVIGGIYVPAEGHVDYQGQSLTGLRPHEVNRRGIARTFQNTELFGEMTALENVMVGAYRHGRYGPFRAAFHGFGFAPAESETQMQALEVLELVGMASDSKKVATTLPFGKQRRLELARALASRPTLLLLDEPAAGLRSAEIEALNRILLNLRDQNRLTILLIDHVMALVMKISDYITVLNFGRKIADGRPEQVRTDPEVVKAYLGERASRAFLA